MTDEMTTETVETQGAERPAGSEAEAGLGATNESGPGANDDTGTTGGDGVQLTDSPATFTREYVESLRTENAGHRTRNREMEAMASELSAALWVERVAALNLLADPADLPVDTDILHDRDAIEAAARALIEAKPHLRTRRITQRVGQGEGTADTPISLLSLLRRSA